ncbi:MAG: tetratricopeptide repeat protein [Pyrinomonadaceae bacterium]
MEAESNKTYAFGSFLLDPKQHVLLQDGKAVHITPKVFDTLALLVANKGVVVDKDTFLSELWPEVVVEESNLTKNISELRKIMRLDGLPTDCIETIPKRGYRFNSEVSTFDGPISPVETSTAEQTDAEKRPSFFSVKFGAAILASAVLIGAAVWYGVGPYQNAGISSVAVLPFVHDGSSQEIELVSSGIQESLISRLSQVPDLLVKPRSSVAKYKGSQLEPANIGTELNVGAIVEGRLVQEGDLITGTFDLVDTSNATVIWSSKFQRRISDASLLDREIAEELLARLRPGLDEGRKTSIARSYTPSSEARIAYLKGRFLGGRRSLEELSKAETFFKQAIAIDPNYAQAWSGLADLYWWQTQSSEALRDKERFKWMRGQAVLAVDRAMSLEPDLAEVRTSRALIRLNNWDFSGAEEDFRRAVELSPSYTFARGRYAFLLTHLGRFEEAFEQLDKVNEIAPLGLQGGGFGYVLRLSGRYEEALDICDKALELYPEDHTTWHTRATILTELGQFKEALEAGKKALELDKEGYNPVYDTQIAIILEKMGDRVGSDKVLAKLMDEVPSGAASPFRIAIIFAARGDNDKAFEWLEKAYNDRELLMTGLRTGPQFRSLHGDPRWPELLKRVGFPD